jgi:hypothetical protein
MGKLMMNSPTLAARAAVMFWRHTVAHDVTLQVAFERQILKPVFSLDRL